MSWTNWNDETDGDRASEEDRVAYERLANQNRCRRTRGLDPLDLTDVAQRRAPLADYHDFPIDSPQSKAAVAFLRRQDKRDDTERAADELETFVAGPASPEQVRGHVSRILAQIAEIKRQEAEGKLLSVSASEKRVAVVLADPPEDHEATVKRAVAALGDETTLGDFPW